MGVGAQDRAAGPILVYVDLDRQIATVYRNGIRIGVTTISSGKPGYDTPTGVFTILEKNVVHHSSKYNNASMPYQQRLTWMASRCTRAGSRAIRKAMAACICRSPSRAFCMTPCREAGR